MRTSTYFRFTLVSIPLLVACSHLPPDPRQPHWARSIIGLDYLELTKRMGRPPAFNPEPYQPKDIYIVQDGSPDRCPGHSSKYFIGFLDGHVSSVIRDDSNDYNEGCKLDVLSESDEVLESWSGNPIGKSLDRETRLGPASSRIETLLGTEYLVIPLSTGKPGEGCVDPFGKHLLPTRVEQFEHGKVKVVLSEHEITAADASAQPCRLPPPAINNTAHIEEIKKSQEAKLKKLRARSEKLLGKNPHFDRDPCFASSIGIEDVGVQIGKRYSKKEAEELWAASHCTRGFIRGTCRILLHGNELPCDRVALMLITPDGTSATVFKTTQDGAFEILAVADREYTLIPESSEFGKSAQQTVHVGEETRIQLLPLAGTGPAGD